MNRRLAFILAPVLVVAAAAAFYVGGGFERGPRSVFGTAPGERVFDFEFRDLDGEAGSLSGMLEDARVVVVAMRDVGCPVARRYGPEMARLEREYGGRGVRFLYLNVNPVDDEARIREGAIERYGLAGRYVRDPDGEIARLLGATTTTEVFVIDRGRTLRYRGAIDDQYGITFTRPAPRHRYLRAALESVLAGETVRIDSTHAEGCYIALSETASLPERRITYHNRISRIVQRNCQVCHRTGGVGPFALESYDQVRAYSAMIRYMAENRLMPPWFADPAHGEWANDRRLPARDLNDLLAWIDAGMPEGDPAAAPVPRGWAGGWTIGEPDAVVRIPEPMPIPAEGVVDYKYVYVKTEFPVDRWIQRMELRPTARNATHHVLVFVEGPDSEDVRGGIDGFFTSWAPGAFGHRMPESAAKLLPKGAWLKFQLHYTPNGAATQDRTELALIFADGPPARVVETASAWNAEFVIPPGAKHHAVTAEYTFEEPGVLLSLFPHMHLRGSAFRFELVRPDGSEQILLDVPRYDFNWQLTYEFAEPIAVAPGTRLRATGWFDNSAENPWNPDPTAEVRFGEQTFEEMMIGYFDWIPVSSRPVGELLAAERGPRVGGTASAVLHSRRP